MTANTPATRKAKGQNAAKLLREALLEKAPHLEQGDIAVIPSGVSGPDLYLSPVALKTYPFTFEVKHVEKLNFWDAIKQSEGHAAKKMLKECALVDPVMCFKRSHEPQRIVLRLDLFLSLAAANFSKQL